MQCVVGCSFVVVLLLVAESAFFVVIVVLEDEGGVVSNVGIHMAALHGWVFFSDEVYHLHILPDWGTHDGLCCVNCRRTHGRPSWAE